MFGKSAVRVSDPPVYPLPDHGVNPIVTGLGDMLSVAYQSDVPVYGEVLSESLTTTLLTNGKIVASVNSVGSHENEVVSGLGRILIGNWHSPASFVLSVSLDC